MSPPIELSRFAQLKATGDLPSPRGVALAIIRMTQDADVSMSELARVIKTDPAFVGRLVKAANGLAGGQRRAIVAVHEALMVLGLPAVRTMALGFSLLSNYRKGHCAGFDYGLFWSSSLLMALSMQTLMQRLRLAAADEAFSAGLLSRVGELAMATAYPVEYSRVLETLRRSPERRLLDLEHQALAMTHADLGAAMLADWGLPAVFYEPIRYFEQPDKAAFSEGSREFGMLQSLILARALTEICQAPEAEQSALMVMSLRWAQRLGLSREEFVDMCVRVAGQWVEWGKLLQFDTAAAPDFATLGQEPASADGTVGGGVTAASGLKVMLVEREEAERQVLRSVLEDAGHQVFESRGGQRLIEQVLDVQPNMLVMGQSEPGLEQGRLIKGLRATRVGRAMYILLLTPEDDEQAMEAFEAGADDFLQRPLRTRLFAARLNAGQRVVRLQQELERDRDEIRHFAAELAISNRRLQEAALTDALTGVPNRRYALERMQQEWAAVVRNHRPLSVMIIDLDDFKPINDAFGHDIGDMVLRQTADALRGALRGQDVLCRTGGDEFLVICPETGLEAARACAERLRLAAEHLRVETGGPVLQLTVSIGVAARDDTMADVDALIKRADRGVYQAKERGRNAVGLVVPS